MDFREERVGASRRAREINERTEESYESHRPETHLSMVCECGLAECDVFLPVTKAEYEDARADPSLFLIDPDAPDRRRRGRPVADRPVSPRSPSGRGRLPR
jgi:hypothetical protein